MDAEKEMEETREKPYKIFKFVKFMEKMLKEENGLRVEMEELVSVKKIDVKYGRNVWREL